MDRSPLGPYADLIAGADAGAFTIPKPIEVARRGLDAIADRMARIEAVGDPRAVAMDHGRSLAPKVIQSGQLDDDDLDLNAVDAVRRAAVRRDDAFAMLTELRDRAALAFRDVVVAHADVIVVDHLRPAYEAAIETLRRVAPRLAGMSSLSEGPVREWVDADAPTRAAFRTLDEVVPRMALIRAAHDAVLGRDRGDQTRYSWLQNIDALWPNRRFAAPWPEDVRHRAVWLVTSEAEPWLPTYAEERDAYDTAEAERQRTRPPFIGPGVRSNPSGGRDRSTRPDISSRRIGGPADRPTRIRIPAAPTDGGGA